MAEVRKPTVLTDRVKTAAIRIAYTEMSVWVLLRPKAQTSTLASCPASIANKLVDVTAPTNNMARNSRPLSRKTVENSRSSISAQLFAHRPDEPQEGDTSERD